MPKIEFLDPEESRRLSTRQIRVDISIYQKTLERLDVGEGGIITAEDGEQLPIIKRRMTFAARQLGREINYKSIGPNELAFRIVA